MNAHDKGDQVRLSVSFTDANGAAANPSSVTLKYRNPAGAVTTIAHGSLVNTPTGTFSYDLTVDQAGVWAYRFEAAGNFIGAEEDEFLVRSSRLSATDP